MQQNSNHDVTKDTIFKCIFGRKGNERITQRFLEDLLKIDLESVTVDWKLEIDRNTIDDKLMVTDVLVKDNELRKYIIEMQKKSYNYILHRFLGYTNKVYIADLKIANKYEKLKKTTLIVIIEEDMKGLPKHNEYHTIISFKTNRNEKVLEDTEEMHIFELGKYKTRKDKTKIEPWLEFIINPNGKEVMEMARTKAELQAAIDQYLMLSADEEVQRLADAQLFARLDRNSQIAEERAEARAEGMAEGRAEGRAKGRKQKAREIAKKLLQDHVNIENIIIYTGLTKEEIENLT